MIFANNTIKLKHENGFEIVFNAKDALNLCEKEKCPDILVQAADSWARVSFIESGVRLPDRRRLYCMRNSGQIIIGKTPLYT